MKPKVAIIYLPYNNLRYIPEVADSWVVQDYPADRIAILIIPNGSSDGSQDFVKDNILPRQEVDLPEVIMIDDGINHGFAGGNNLGIKWALENGFDYVFLNNGDLKLHPNTISELVEVMESDKSIGSSQSQIMLWNNENTVNTTGGVIHVAGNGSARDNGKNILDIKVQDKEEIAYCSGAAVIYSLAALKKVGFLEKGFFMYHEDLELGLRLRFAGYKNVLSIKSLAFHDYKFGKNSKMFQWIETYRYVVLLSYMRFRTLVLLFPLLLMIEIGVWLMALKGGWLKAKFKALISFWSPKNLRLIKKMRRRAQHLRVIKDKDWLRFVSGRVEDQGKELQLMNIINDVIEGIWQLAKRNIDW